MLIRINRPRQGEVDGIALDTFEVGLVYDLDPVLATYLVTTASAELVEGNVAEAPLREVRAAVFGERLRAVAADRGKPRRLSKNHPPEE